MIDLEKTTPTQLGEGAIKMSEKYAHYVLYD